MSRSEAGLTSERPPLHLVLNVISKGWHLLWMDAKSCAIYKAKVYNHILPAAATDAWLPVIEAEAVATLHNFLKKPDCFYTEM